MLLKSLRLIHFRCPLILLQKRSFNFKQSSRYSISHTDRIRDFIALLGSKERKLFHEELNRLQSDANLNKELTRSPTVLELRQIFIQQSLPFIGFGFFDNIIMIIAGDYIDRTIGFTLGLSTMAAAGLGNAISDIAGVPSGYYIERMADKFGVKFPNLSVYQLRMRKTRWAIQIGRVFGVTFGCIIGMFPLLFMTDTAQIDKIETQPKVT